jgi:hypothetical protein
MRSDDLNNSHSIGEIRGELGAVSGKYKPEFCIGSGFGKARDEYNGSAMPRVADSRRDVGRRLRRAKGRRCDE